MGSNPIETNKEAGYDPRTPEYYENMRSKGYTEAEIERARARFVMIGSEDTFTNYFQHEANNALGPFTTCLDENGKPIIELGKEDFERSREQLLNVRQGLGWFKQDGLIPKDKIVLFIEEVEQMGEWDLQKVLEINNRYNTLRGRQMGTQ